MGYSDAREECVGIHLPEGRFFFQSLFGPGLETVVPKPYSARIQSRDVCSPTEAYDSHFFCPHDTILTGIFTY